MLLYGQHRTWKGLFKFAPKHVPMAVEGGGDAAAATGGVPLGGVYHNAGAVRIRIA